MRSLRPELRLHTTIEKLHRLNALGATAESFFELLNFGRLLRFLDCAYNEGEVIKSAAIAKCLGRK